MKSNGNEEQTFPEKKYTDATVVTYAVPEGRTMVVKSLYIHLADFTKPYPPQ